MFARDKFPYGQYGELTDVDLAEAKKNLLRFTFVGINEMFDTSLVLLAEALRITLEPQDFDKERTALRATEYSRFLVHLEGNSTLQRRIRDVNRLDMALYNFARQIFCTTLENSEALEHPMIEVELDQRNVCFDIWREGRILDPLLQARERRSSMLGAPKT